MSLEPLAALLVAAVLFFWATGAHNRLVTLRNAVAQAGARLAEALAQRGAAQTQWLREVQPPLAAEAGSLQALADAQQLEQTAARALAARPLDATAAREWLAVEVQRASSAARVLALLEQHAEVGLQPAVAEPLAVWQEVQARLPLLRQAFNDAAAEHDRALLQLPTRLLVPLFRFASAGRV